MVEKQIDDSTSLIVASIESQSMRECERLHSQAETLYDEKVKALEAEIKSKYESQIRYELEKKRIEAGKKASALETEYKAGLAALRGRITEEVFAQVQEKLCAFTQTAGYASLLQQSAKALAALYPSEAVVFMRSADKVFEPLVREAFGREVRFETDDSITGGLRVFFPQAEAVADDTLDTRFEACKKSFLGTSGLGTKG